MISIYIWNENVFTSGLSVSEAGQNYHRLQWESIRPSNGPRYCRTLLFPQHFSRYCRSWLIPQRPLLSRWLYSLQLPLDILRLVKEIVKFWMYEFRAVYHNQLLHLTLPVWVHIWHGIHFLVVYIQYFYF